MPSCLSRHIQRPSPSLLPRKPPCSITEQGAGVVHGTKLAKDPQAGVSLFPGLFVILQTAQHGLAVPSLLELVVPLIGPLRVPLGHKPSSFPRSWWSASSPLWFNNHLFSELSGRLRWYLREASFALFTFHSFIPLLPSFTPSFLLLEALELLTFRLRPEEQQAPPPVALPRNFVHT